MRLLTGELTGEMSFTGEFKNFVNLSLLGHPLLSKSANSCFLLLIFSLIMSVLVLS